MDFIIMKIYLVLISGDSNEYIQQLFYKTIERTSLNYPHLSPELSL